MTNLKMISKLQVQEQRISMRDYKVTECALLAKEKWKHSSQRDEKKQNLDEKTDMDGGAYENVKRSKIPLPQLVRRGRIICYRSLVQG